jgi:hypothetical protein
MHRDKKSEPKESFQAEQSLASSASQCLAKLAEDFGPQKFLERFQWKLPMEIDGFIFVWHCKTSLGLGLSPVVTPKEVFTLVLGSSVLEP